MRQRFHGLRHGNHHHLCPLSSQEHVLEESLIDEAREQAAARGYERCADSYRCRNSSQRVFFLRDVQEQTAVQSVGSKKRKTSTLSQDQGDPETWHRGSTPPRDYRLNQTTTGQQSCETEKPFTPVRKGFRTQKSRLGPAVRRIRCFARTHSKIPKTNKKQQGYFTKIGDTAPHRNHYPLPRKEFDFCLTISLVPFLRI